ncbi:MAG: hypothetical protein EKK33_07285 [Bradyrhizobiaceae bacterium]|nr:MAG: hypothetical protein EKK33_07285 [Bradyrhizobiaceae bacterium]
MRPRRRSRPTSRASVAFHRALYKIRGQIDESKVLEAAGTLGIDVARMKIDMRDAAIEGMLERNIKLAEVLRINGTPGFVVGDEVRTGAVDLSSLQALISKGRDVRQSGK